MLRLRLAIAALFLLLVVQPALAVVTVVTSAPPTTNITYNPGSSTFTVTWVINRTLIPGPFFLQSPPGEFFISSVVGTTNTINRLIPGNPKTLTITETVTVPQFVMRSALETNDGEFLYQRRFTDDNGGTFIQGVARVHVTGGMGGPLGLSEVTLTFDNNSTFSSVHENDSLRAIAHIHSGGAGQLTGIWEVSDVNPGTNAFFRPIKTETVTLTGQRLINLTSPLLPTDSEGRYNVRFRVINPANSRIEPQITYFVNGKGKNTKGGISAAAPAPDANVGNGTQFRWNAIKGAAAYRLQILDLSGGPVASMLLRSNGTVLSAFVLAQLQGPATYQWRVSALDADGNVLGTSLPRTMKVKGR